MRFGRKALFESMAALSMAALLGGVAPALAIDIPIGSGAQNRAPGITRLDLNILESRERRRAYQEQQQRFRAEDRRTNNAARQRPEIPLMQGSCHVQVLGNKFLRNCR